MALDNYMAPPSAKSVASSVATKDDGYMGPQGAKFPYPTVLKTFTKTEVSALTVDNSSSSESALGFQYQMGADALADELQAIGNISTPPREMMERPFEHVEKPSPPAKEKYSPPPISRTWTAADVDIPHPEVYNKEVRFEVEEQYKEADTSSIKSEYTPEVIHATQTTTFEIDKEFAEPIVFEPKKAADLPDETQPQPAVAKPDDGFTTVVRRKKGRKSGSRKKNKKKKAPDKKSISSFCTALSPTYYKKKESSSESSNTSSEESQGDVKQEPDFQKARSH